jgi:hypothetical protein
LAIGLHTGSGWFAWCVFLEIGLLTFLSGVMGGMRLMDFSTLIEESTKDFTGREWVFAEIDRWLANPDAPRYFIITGEPGIGKTAIAARLTEIRDLNAYHFCIARQASTIDPITFTRSLSHQLARIDGFALGLLKSSDISIEARQSIGQVHGQAINVQINNLVVNAPSAVTAFNRRVSEPLRSLYDDDFDQQLVILIDALDEAVQFRGRETIVDLLANERGLPSQVRFVLTSRPEGEALRHFERLETPYLILDAGQEENQHDVRAYVRYRLETSEALQRQLAEQAITVEAFVKQVAEISGGNFLYLVWLLRAIAEGAQRLDDLESLPEGLDSIYRAFLRTRQIGQELQLWRKRYRPLLGVLSVAQEPLTTEYLAHFTSLGRQAVHDALLDVQQFLDPVGFDKGEHQLYHQTVADFLGSEEQAGEFWIDLPAMHQRVAEYYLNPYASDWSDCELYGLRYLPVHLIEADKQDELRKLLNDFDWLQAKFKTVGIRTSIDDYQKAFLSLSEKQQGSLRIWLRFLQKREHLFRLGDEHWPANRILLQLAVEHADDSPVTRAAEAWLRRGKCNWIGLRREQRPERTSDILNLTFPHVTGWTWATEKVLVVRAGKDLIEVDFSHGLDLKSVSEETDLLSSAQGRLLHPSEIEETHYQQVDETIDLLGRFRWQHNTECNWGKRVDYWTYCGEFYMAWGENRNEPSSYERTVVSPTHDALALVTSDRYHRLLRVCGSSGDLQSTTVVLSRAASIVTISPSARYLIYEVEDYLYIRPVHWANSWTSEVDDVPVFATKDWWTFGSSRSFAIIETYNGVYAFKAHKGVATVTHLARNIEQIWVGALSPVEPTVVHCHGDNIGVACVLWKAKGTYEILWKLWKKSEWFQAPLEWDPHMIVSCRLVADGTIKVELEDYSELVEEEMLIWFRFFPDGTVVALDEKPSGKATNQAIRHGGPSEYLQLEIPRRGHTRWYGSKGLVWVSSGSKGEDRIMAWVLNPPDGWNPFPVTRIE